MVLATINKASFIFQKAGYSTVSGGCDQLYFGLARAPLPALASGDGVWRHWEVSEKLNMATQIELTFLKDCIFFSLKPCLFY